MEKVVEIYDDVPRTGSFMLAKGLERDHKAVRDLIEKYRADFEDFSVLKTRKLKSTGGRAANEYMLDEDQFMFLGTLLRNSDKVVAFKKAIIQQFKKARKELERLNGHKSQEEYKVTREAGKIVRRQTTDVMKDFVAYAKSQGSKNADRYYMVISKMLNDLLFIAEGRFKCLRDVLTVQQLMTVSSAEQIVDRGLRDGMSRKKYYKEIYKDIKSRITIFVELHGKSEVIDTILKDIKQLE